MKAHEQAQPGLNFAAPGTYQILEGSALPLKEPQKIVISGDIKTVFTFLKTRKLNEGRQGLGRQYINPDKAVITIDKEMGTIELELDPEDYYGARVIAKMQKSPELAQFCINGNKEFTQDEIVELIKFSGRFFVNPEQHRIILKSYQHFEAKVQTDLKNEKDNRGNFNALLARQVSTELPHEFQLYIPIFKGMNRETFTVEIAFNVTDRGVKFWLESVQLEEIIEQRKTEIIDEMASEWGGFPIIYK